MLSASRHLRNFKLAARPPFQTPAVFSVYETDYQILKRDLQRLFPEKFLPENRSYVNVCPFKSGVDCYFNFGQYRDHNVFPKNRPANATIQNLDLNFLDPTFCQEFLRLFTKTNLRLLARHEVDPNDIELISNGKTSATLALNDASKTVLKVQNNVPLLTLETPEFHPLLSYNLNVPVRFKSNLNAGAKDRYRTVVLHSNHLQRNLFEIADFEEFMNEPHKLMKNVVILALQNGAEFENSSPIYVSQLLHNRIERDRSKLIQPFYKERLWKVFKKPDVDNVQLKVLTYNTLSSQLGHLGAKGPNSKKEISETSETTETYSEPQPQGKLDPTQFSSFLAKIAGPNSAPAISGWSHLKDEPEIHFSYRKQILYDEVATYDPDIIAYQEGESRAVPENYHVIENYNSNESSANADLLIAYKPEKFSVLEQTTTTFHSVASQKESVTLGGTNHRMLIAYLLEKQSNKPVIVVNTHLYWKDIKVKELQFKILLRELAKLQSSRPVPLVLLGDFNMDLEENQRLFATHGLKFKLALRNGRGVEYTTKLKSGFCKRLDWMVYKDCEHLGYLQNPTDEYVIEHGYMPSKMFPSDHLAQGFLVEI